jgi:hypothetical protein
VDVILTQKQYELLSAFLWEWGQVVPNPWNAISLDSELYKVVCFLEDIELRFESPGSIFFNLLQSISEYDKFLVCYFSAERDWRFHSWLGECKRFEIPQKPYIWRTKIETRATSERSLNEVLSLNLTPCWECLGFIWEDYVNLKNF